MPSVMSYCCGLNNSKTPPQDITFGVPRCLSLSYFFSPLCRGQSLPLPADCRGGGGGRTPTRRQQKTGGLLLEYQFYDEHQGDLNIWSGPKMQHLSVEFKMKYLLIGIGSNFSPLRRNLYVGSHMGGGGGQIDRQTACFPTKMLPLCEVRGAVVGKVCSACDGSCHKRIPYRLACI